MGCCVPSMLGQKGTEITGNAREILDSSIGDIKNVRDFKIKEGMLVKETKADPYSIYETISVLGEGAFGKVEKVRHKISKERSYTIRE